MEKTRMADMVERYGEICSQQMAAKILGVVPETVARMMKDRRLRRVGRRVDVRSIAAYIENPQQMNFEAKARKNVPTTRLSEAAFLAAAKAGRWAGRRW